MPHSSEDPPTDRISAELPRAVTPETGESDPPSASRNGTPDNGEARGSPRRRRRRRRRPPREAGPAEATAADQAQAKEPTMVGHPPQSGNLPVAPPRDAEPRRRRRRRRAVQHDAGSAEVTAGGEAQAAESAPGPRPSFAQPDGDVSGNSPSHPGRRHRRRRPPRAAISTDETAGGESIGGESAPTADSEPHERPRSRRRRRWPRRSADPTAAGADRAAGSPTADATPTATPGDRSAPFRGSRTRGPRDRRTRAEGLPERSPADRDRGSRDQRVRSKGPRDRQQGRGRDAPNKRPEQQLYALQSVIDRGFEDMADEAEDSVTRRVHWTIIKRTVADQKTGKPLSAIYVLQRDGIDTEFPNLSAARAAANKTIVHPEKLTLSKAEHAAAKT